MGQTPLTGVVWTVPTTAQWLSLALVAVAVIAIAITFAVLGTLLFPPFHEQVAKGAVQPLSPPLPWPIPPVAFTVHLSPAAELEPLATPRLHFARWMVERGRLSG